ncbi:MAG TPA: GNAT family N-acetyltransferase [Burkholderiales bacterium]|nr:GNAT family N-acetyltransferase [Burkholderiales bacterium]
MKTRSVTLRLATVADAGEIAMMSRDLIEHGLGWSWTRGRVVRSIKDLDTNAIVACNGKDVVSFALAHFGDVHAHLNLLAVRPAYQRRGIGRVMLRWLEESARVAGITAMHLEVRVNNLGARRFYRSWGFQEMSILPRYYGGVESAVWMARDLRIIARSPSA